jgi:hypothetical protein
MQLIGLDAANDLVLPGSVGSGLFSDKDNPIFVIRVHHSVNQMKVSWADTATGDIILCTSAVLRTAR